MTWWERMRQWWLTHPACCNGIVHLNPYGRDAVTLAVDLANEPPATAAELERRCVAAGLVLGGPMTEAEFGATREYLDRWIAVADAPTAAERAERLNALLAVATAHPRLTDHDGTWHLHFRDVDRPPAAGPARAPPRDGAPPPAAIVAAILSAGTALHLVGRGMGRLGRCAEDGC